MRPVFLACYRLLYERLVRPLLFRGTPQDAHERTLRLMAWLDVRKWLHPPLRWLNWLAFAQRPVTVGGVTLPHPLILAAGFVKGEGFTDEDAALAAVTSNIIPGWRSLPLLVGAVEFGSFTRYPRLGNPGTVIWRDEATRSTQNRVGLKNPGAFAAAEFLAAHRADLPPVYGINIAVSPGVSDPQQECREVHEALSAFIGRALRPSWVTLNISCPNTEDDPGSHQTESRARNLCAALMRLLQPQQIPLWVKISPDLAAEQYRAVLHAFADTGVRAVIAANTLGLPAPDGTTAGVGGGKLHQNAINVVSLLSAEKARQNYPLDIIACGGVQDGSTQRDFAAHGVRAMQYWSALIYRGPLAAALIEQESKP
jgi:dihydroorotate dehydrogenase